MKLYATITSERATKGQGGNTSLNIKLYGENELFIGDLILSHCSHNKPCHEPRYLVDVRNTKNLKVRQYDFIEAKAKKQKGEFEKIGKCGGNPLAPIYRLKQ